MHAIETRSRSHQAEWGASSDSESAHRYSTGTSLTLLALHERSAAGRVPLWIIEVPGTPGWLHAPDTSAGLRAASIKPVVSCKRIFLLIGWD